MQNLAIDFQIYSCPSMTFQGTGELGLKCIWFLSNIKTSMSEVQCMPGGWPAAGCRMCVSAT